MERRLGLLFLVVTFMASCGYTPRHRELPVKGDAAFRLVSETGAGELVGSWTSDERFTLEPEVLLTAEDVDNAAIVREEATGRIVLSIQMTDAGAERLAEISEQYKGRTLAIVTGGQVAVAAVIMDRLGAEIRVSGPSEEEITKQHQALVKRRRRRL